MNLSLIFTLIVETNLSVVQQIFVDSVKFIAHICNIKKINISVFTTERNSQVILVVNFIPSKF